MDKILLVEDEIDLATIVIDWLKEEYLVEAESDGEAALAALERTEYDVLLLDWMLPGISGIDICRSYRNSGGKAVVLVLSARNSFGARQEALAAGADDFLSKPYQLKELSRKIAALSSKAASPTSLSCIEERLPLN